MKTWKKLLALVMAVVMIGTLPIGSIGVFAEDEVIAMAIEDDYLGYGFNALTGDVTNPESGIKSNQIIDLSSFEIREINEATQDSGYLSGNTLSELAQNYSFAFSIGQDAKVPVYGLSVGMEKKFNISASASRTDIVSELWEVYYSRIKTKNLSVKNWDSAEYLKSFLAENFKKRITEIEEMVAAGEDATEKIDKLFNDYGTHVVMSYYIGGTMEFTNHVYSTESKAEDDLKAMSSLGSSLLGTQEITVGAEFSFDAAAKISWSETKSNEDRRIRAYGGIYSGTSTITETAYSDWLTSLQNGNTRIIDFDYSNFPGVWELANDEASAVIKARYEAMSKNNIIGYLYETANENIEEYSYISCADGYTAEERYVAPGSTLYIGTLISGVTFETDQSLYATIVDANAGIVKVANNAIENATFTITAKSAYQTIGQLKFIVKKECKYNSAGTESYFSGGYGTAGRPYLISTVADLDKIREYPDAYYKLVNDITFANNSITPIPNFSGVLDGNGYTISGWKFSKESSELEYDIKDSKYYVGFGFIKMNWGTIKNLTFKDCQINVKYNSVAANHDVLVGVVCGRNETSGTIKNVFVTTSTVYASSDSGGKNYYKVACLGGICGVNNGKITKCGVYNCDSIKGYAFTRGENGESANTYVGGLVGWNGHTQSVITDVFSYNNIIEAKSSCNCDPGDWLWGGGWSGWTGAFTADVVGHNTKGITRALIANNQLNASGGNGTAHYTERHKEVDTIAFHADGWSNPKDNLADCIELESIASFNITASYDNAGWVKDSNGYPNFIKEKSSVPELYYITEIGADYVKVLNLPIVEYSINNNGWQQDTNGELTELNANTSYKIYVRLKEDNTTSPYNNYIEFDVKTKKYESDTPSVPEATEITENSITLKATDGYEYSIDRMSWQNSNVFTNLNADTEYTFYQRVKEMDDTSASEISEPLVIKTKKIVTAKMTVSDVTVMPGGECQVKVSVEENPGIAGLKVRINFDNTVLVPVIIEKGSALTSGTLTTNLDQGGDLSALNYVSAFWSNPSNVTSDGDVLIVTFKANENAESGTYPITVSYEEGDITDQSYNDVDFNIINGSIEITDVVKGDIFKDGKVNTKDSVKLNQYLADWDIEFTSYEEAAADVFADGKINTKDSVKLSQYLADWDVELMELFEIGSITFEASEEEIVDGYVDMPVTITENGGVAGFKLKLNYDNTLLTPVSVTKGDALVSGTMTSNIDMGGDLSNLKAVSVFWSNPSNVVNTGVAFTVRFKVADGVEEDVPVTLSYEEGDICDQSFNDLSVTLKDGSVVAEKAMDYTVTSLAGVVAGGSFYAEAEIIKNTDRNEVDTIVIAVYKDDVLVDRIYMRSKFANGQRAVFGGFLTGLEGATLKAFVWDSMTSMNTLSNVIEK